MSWFINICEYWTPTCYGVWLWPMHCSPSEPTFKPHNLNMALFSSSLFARGGIFATGFEYSGYLSSVVCFAPIIYSGCDIREYLILLNSQKRLCPASAQLGSSGILHFKAYLIFHYDRCIGTESPRVKMSLCMLIAHIRIIITPYRFIPWPLWIMLYKVSQNMIHFSIVNISVNPKYTATPHISLDTYLRGLLPCLISE